MRLLTRMRLGNPTTTLLKQTEPLSVQQMIAFQKLIIVHKVIKNAKPVYLAERLKLRNDGVKER